MNKKIAFIEITFENIDFIKIPVAYFKNFTLTPVPTEHLQKCSMMFELLPQVNEDSPAFEGDVFQLGVGGITLFDRLQRGEITQIKLFYENMTSDEYHVLWQDSDDEFHNALQKSYLNSDGSLCIEINHK